MGDFELVIWGSGRLGLGLVADRAAAAGVSTCLAVRREGSNPRLANSLHSQRSYRLSTPSDSHVVTVGSVLWNDSGRGQAKLMELLTTTTDVLFVTCARASGQIAAIPVVQAAVAARREAGTDGMFVLAPCENATVPALTRLAWDLIGDGFGYLDVMVDRICPEITPGSSGLFDVVAEAPSEWAASIKMAKDPHNRQSFARVRQVLVDMNMKVLPDITLVKARKRFLMNGVQTCLALLATGTGFETLDQYMTANPDALVSLSEQYAIALATEHVEFDDEVELTASRRWYADRILQSGKLTKEGDTAARIISRLYSGSSSSYLHDIASKVAVARDAYLRAQRLHGLADIDETYLGEAHWIAIELARQA